MEVAKAQIRLAKDQIRATHLQLKEQIRPVLDLVRELPDLPWEDPKQELRLLNIGFGPAKNIRIEFRRLKENGKEIDLGTHKQLKDLTVVAKQRTVIGVQPHHFNGLRVQYESTAGDKYESDFSFARNHYKSAHSDDPRRPLSYLRFAFSQRNSLEFADAP